MARASERVRARLNALEPANLRFKHARRYQWARWITLTASWAFIVGIPLLQAARLERESAGLFGGRALPVSVGEQVVGAPTSLHVLGIEFIDPLAAAGVALSGGASWALAFGALVPIVLVGVFGRFFCSWLCPYATLVAVSNAARALLAKLGLRPHDAALPKRTNLVVLGGLLIATVLTGSQLALLVYPPAIVGREVWRLVYFGALGSGAAIIAVLFTFDTFVSRTGTCRYLCPGGAVFTLLGHWSPFTIVRDSKRCTDCTLCDVVCPMAQRPMTDNVTSGCDRCARCVAVCPTKALRIQRSPAHRSVSSKR